MKVVNLFGEVVDTEKIKEYKQSSPYQRFKQRWQYRQSDNKDRRCKNCKYHHRLEYHNKYYHKCELLGISHSEATDVRVSCVCNRFEVIE